jgi:hypothetical protein
MGMEGLYLAISLAVVPVSVSTTIRDADTSLAVFTADDAMASAGLTLG